MTQDYHYPTDQLLSYGECQFVGTHYQKWPNYLALGFTEEHIPELIRMATDDDLNWADSESLEVWAPVHAWRTLAQLQAEAAINPLINLLEGEESDWITEELPLVYGLIGAKAIPVLADYLADKSNDLHFRISIAYSLERIGHIHQETRIACVMILTQQLEKFTLNHPELNGFLICYLTDLKAIESLSTIKTAYEKDCVDFSVIGDLEDVEIYMGIKTERSAPPTYPTLAEKYGLTSLLEKIASKPYKVGRNDPCPCGSGKKYKKCCLNKPN